MSRRRIAGKPGSYLRALPKLLSGFQLSPSDVSKWVTRQEMISITSTDVTARLEERKGFSLNNPFPKREKDDPIQQKLVHTTYVVVLPTCCRASQLTRWTHHKDSKENAYGSTQKEGSIRCEKDRDKVGKYLSLLLGKGCGRIQRTRLGVILLPEL